MPACDYFGKKGFNLKGPSHHKRIKQTTTPYITINQPTWLNTMGACVSSGEGAGYFRQPHLFRHLGATMAEDDYQHPLLILTKLNGREHALFLYGCGKRDEKWIMS